MSVTMLPGGGSVTGFRPNQTESPVQSGPTASNYVYSSKGWDFLTQLFPEGTKYGDFLRNNHSKVMSGENAFGTMATLASQGDEAAIQWMANYFASEESSKTAREWTSQREDTAYQRLIADLNKAGISPYVLTGATPSVSSSSGHSYSGTEMTSRANNRDTIQSNNNQKALQAVMSFIGVMLAALIYAAA